MKYIKKLSRSMKKEKKEMNTMSTEFYKEECSLF